VTKPRVLVVGDVVNDIMVETRMPLTHGEDNPAVITTRPGGSAANQASWMARLGLDVVFAGRAGAWDAAFHREELARFGAEPLLAADESVATVTIVVLTGGEGERTMVTDRGANLRLRSADVPAALLDGAALLHLTGYSFFAPETREVALGLLAEAGRRGVPFTVDPGSAAFLRELAPGTFLDWTRGAAVCLPNRDEATVLAGGADPAAMATALARHYGVVVLKLGPDGALVAVGDAPPAEVPAEAATVRDTTGAGDAFCAGFLAAWLSGGDPVAAARSAARAAAMAVSVLGGRPETTDLAGPDRYLRSLPPRPLLSHLTGWQQLCCLLPIDTCALLTDGVGAGVLDSSRS
jgi:sugar/nucleoside kinase (ribokinase family)